MSKSNIITLILPRFGKRDKEVIRLDNLQVMPQSNSSGAITDFDGSSVQEMALKLSDTAKKMELVQQFFNQVMIKGVDYGTVPGVEKPFLQKPGAEKLCVLYNYAPMVKQKTEDKDVQGGFYSVELVIQLVHRGTGIVVGEGIGSANTYENRYRYRWVSEYKLPRHLNKETIFSEEREEWKNGRKTGNTYFMYRIENEDMHSLWNTVLKMAKKRAFVDATLTCTHASSIFALEEQELDAWVNGADVEGEAPTTTRRATQETTTRRQPAPGASTATDKNRALKLVERIKGGADWNWLAERAGEVLGRSIRKVIQDVKDGEWKTVADYLEQYQIDGDQSQDDLPFPRGVRMT